MMGYFFHKGKIFQSIQRSKIGIIDNKILNSNYSNDIVIINDTAMTNLYGLPLETMVVIDSEDHTQLLAYSILLKAQFFLSVSFFL